ncbi:DUF2520 domain-containing protein [Candidatus Bipolaricaulota bacterium]|nr:DUF2520 domain-containing protein [Candidatus Bipolaricaulota bacterium]TFH09310.1 MAG: DUF2520 domain-containing protein [Candidatus Atribacteria bacterium]
MNQGRQPTLGFIGTGVVGTALAEALSQAGYTVVAVFNRNHALGDALASRLPNTQSVDSAQAVADLAELTFLTVSDDAIASVADSIRWTDTHSAVHCNGAASIELLRSVQDQGAAVGAMHPLQSFASVEQARKNIPGSAFAIDTSSEVLRSTLENMVHALGGVPLTLQGSKVLYHASAVIASNYLVTLLHLASGLWSHLGLSQAEGLKALLPLVRGTVENLEAVGLPNALTGPIARGDVGTIKRHLATLGDVAPEILPVYKELAQQAIPIALHKGTIDSATADQLHKTLDGQSAGVQP